MQKISIYLLESFIHAAKEKNLNIAADKLNITQPTLSRHLQTLEECMPQPLFKMQGRNKVLTDYGVALLEAIETKFINIEFAIDQLNQIYNDESNVRLKVGGRRELLDKIFTPIDFKGNLNLIPLNSQEVLQQLQSNQLDIGISRSESNSSELIRKKILLDSPKLLIPKKWYQGESEKKWSDLCHDHPFATYDKSTPYLKEFTNAHKITKNIKVNFISNDWRTTFHRVQQNLSWSIIPSSYVLEDKNITELKLNTQIFEPTQYYLYYKKELHTLDWFKKLIQKLL